MAEDKLINVFGCFRCKKLYGDMEEIESRDGYQFCPACGADIDYFWLNVTKMRFQESREITEKMMAETARIIGGDIFRYDEIEGDTSHSGNNNDFYLGQE